MSASMPVRGCAAAILMAASAVAGAQFSGGSYTFSITPFYSGDSDLDEGGEASFAGVLTTIGRNWALDERSSVGFRLQLGYENWDFTDVQGFGGADPWDELYRFTVSAPYRFVAGNGWIWNVSPTVGFTGESGASSSDALEYGATLSSARRVHPDLLLGLGIGVFDKIDETSVFPFLIVDWQINERWRLSNPLQAGPAGPAGLELSYALSNGWETGLAAAYRSNRHRLDKDGPFPDGVGEHQYLPVVARVGRNLSETLKVDFYLGAETDARLRVEDGDGNGLFEDDQDPGVLTGVSLVGRF